MNDKEQMEKSSRQSKRSKGVRLPDKSKPAQKTDAAALPPGNQMPEPPPQAPPPYYYPQPAHPQAWGADGVYQPVAQRPEAYQTPPPPPQSYPPPPPGYPPPQSYPPPPPAHVPPAYPPPAQGYPPPPAHVPPAYPPPAQGYPPPPYGYQPPVYPLPPGGYGWQYPPYPPAKPPNKFTQIITAFAVTLGFLFAHFFLVGMITGICLAVLYLILGGSIEGLDNLEQAEEVLTDVLFESTASTIISFVVLTIAYAISILATWLLIRYTWLKAPSRQINLRRPDRQDIICIVKYSTIQMGVFIGMVVLAYFFSDALGLEDGTEKPVYRPDAPESSPYIGLIFGISIIGLLVPFIEEVIFRGVLFKALRKNLKFWLAFLLSGVLFTLLHYNNDLNAATNLYVFVQILALTYFMTLAYEKRRNLWVPISLHALHNLRIVILAAIIIAAGWDVGV